MIYLIVILVCGQPDLIIYHSSNQINAIPYQEIIKSTPLSEQLIVNLSEAIKNETYFEITEDRGYCA